MRLAGVARTPRSTRRGASRLCRILVMQAVFSAASVAKRKQLKTSLMLSADCSAIRENRRNFLRRRSVVRCSRIAHWRSAVVVTLRERTSVFAHRSSDRRTRDFRRSQLGVVRCSRIAHWRSAVVVTLRERKACSLIAPPIVGRAISDARSSMLSAARASS